MLLEQRISLCCPLVLPFLLDGFRPCNQGQLDTEGLKDFTLLLRYLAPVPRLVWILEILNDIDLIYESTVGMALSFLLCIWSDSLTAASVYSAE